MRVKFIGGSFKKYLLFCLVYFMMFLIPLKQASETFLTSKVETVGDLFSDPNVSKEQTLYNLMGILIKQSLPETRTGSEMKKLNSAHVGKGGQQLMTNLLLPDEALKETPSKLLRSAENFRPMAIGLLEFPVNYKKILALKNSKYNSERENHSKVVEELVNFLSKRNIFPENQEVANLGKTISKFLEGVRTSSFRSHVKDFCF